VVIFGLKRAEPASTVYSPTKMLEEVLRAGPPVLQANELAYRYQDTELPLTHFRLSLPDTGQVLAELETVGVQTLDAWQTLLGRNGVGFDLFQPVLPLTAGHTAMAIAAGIVNGTAVEIADQAHLIKGSTSKRLTVTTEVEATEDGNQRTIREREQLVQTITALNLTDGRLTTHNSLDDKQGFADFLLAHQASLVASIERNFPPLFEPERDLPTWLPALNRVRAPGKLTGRLVAEGLLPAQQVRAAALAARLQTDKAVLLVGEMGSGKSATSLALTALIGQGQWKLVIVCPAQITAKWKRETETVLADFGVKVHIIGHKHKQADGQGQWRKVGKPILDTSRAMAEPNPSVLVMSYETAKMGARWDHAPARQRKMVTYTVEVEEPLPSYPYVRIVEKPVTKMLEVLCCPDCGQVLRNEYGPLRKIEDMGKRKWWCSDCGAALWQQQPFSYGGRVAIADFLNRHYSGCFNLILDEAHHTKGADTDVGYAAADLVAAATKVIAMTGTLYSGKASGIFHLLYRLLPAFRQLYGYNEVQRFVEHHGLQETITHVKSSDRYHSTYGYSRENVRVREIPGVSPGMVTLLLPNTAFLKLADMDVALPPYVEERLPIPLDERLAEGVQQIDHIYDDAVKLARAGNPGLLSSWLYASLAWLDCPVDERIEARDKEGHLVGTYPIDGLLAQNDDLPEDLLAKDQALLDLIAAELAQERGVGVYFAQVNRRDWMGRIQKLLKTRGIHSEILRQSTCKPEERESWYRQFVRRCRNRGQEPVLLANGNLVKEGLDLVELPTLIETGIEYRINDLRQRDRRSWRLTQDRPVRVLFLYYENTMQETALQLVAAKLKAAHLVEGNLAEGLAAMDLDDGNLMDALMKAVAKGRARPRQWDGMQVAQVITPLPRSQPVVVKKPPQPQPDLDINEVEVGAGAIQYAFF
jgi:hypothetical protein